MTVLFHLLVVAATAEMSDPVADAADLRTAGQEIALGRCLTGGRLDKKQDGMKGYPSKMCNNHQ